MKDLIRGIADYKVERDVLAPDRCVAEGWRRVTKAGTVRFAHLNWTCDGLERYAGRF